MENITPPEASLAPELSSANSCGHRSTGLLPFVWYKKPIRKTLPVGMPCNATVLSDLIFITRMLQTLFASSCSSADPFLRSRQTAYIKKHFDYEENVEMRISVSDASVPLEHPDIWMLVESQRRCSHWGSSWGLIGLGPSSAAHPLLSSTCQHPASLGEGGSRQELEVPNARLCLSP